MNLEQAMSDYFDDLSDREKRYYEVHKIHLMIQLKDLETGEILLKNSKFT
jgi:hypothetical protein